MSTARAIDQHLKQCRRAVSPNAVRVVVMDGHNVHCLNEEGLDTWWASLSPGLKAEIYEAALGDGEERCKFCGCTQNRACPGGCAWLDPNHTVCSAQACAEKYKAEVLPYFFHPPTLAELQSAGSHREFIAGLESLAMEAADASL